MLTDPHIDGALKGYLESRPKEQANPLPAPKIKATAHKARTKTMVVGASH